MVVGGKDPMPCSGTRKCPHCHTFFKPHPRSKGRQKYCFHLDCQKVRKQLSHKNWLKKPQNQNYFCGPDNVQRVRQWRAKNPHYWKRTQADADNASPLQDPLMTQTTDNEQKSTDLKPDPLQDALMAQPFVLIGLIAHLTGSALQDDIVRTSRKLQQLGEDFLNNPNSNKGDNDVISSLTQSRTTPANSNSVQLDRSPSGT